MKGIKTKTIEVPDGAFGFLSGVWIEPDEPKGALILSHCFTCHKNYKVQVYLARAAAEAGWAALRFDYAGLGESQGDFAETTVDTMIEDLKAVVGWVERKGIGPIMLAGHSMGGAISLLTAAELESVRGLALVATSSNLERLADVLPSMAVAGDPEGSFDVEIGGLTHTIGAGFLDSLRRDESLAEVVSRLERPFLVLHGTSDETVEIDHGLRLFEAAGQPKSFFALPGSDHLLSRSRDTDLAGEILAAWLGGVAKIDSDAS